MPAIFLPMTQPASLSRSVGSTAVIDTPVGRIRVSATEKAVTGIDYVHGKAGLKTASTPLTREAVRQLRRYLKNAESAFDLPLQIEGTDFQRRVWRALRGIKAGKTMTYGELAAKLGSGARAVGNACRRNPISIIVPCHRVIAANSLGGYSGKTRGRTLDRKRWLLAHEGFIR